MGSREIFFGSMVEKERMFREGEEERKELGKEKQGMKGALGSCVERVGRCAWIE